MEKLALFGGQPTIRHPLKPYNSIGESEITRVMDVIKTGELSSFYGSWGDQFLGGPLVKEFEKNWCDKFKVKSAVSMNSATSCLMAAMGAAGIEPGNEVILPPYTMSATAMAPLVYGGIPVFVDIEPETFCIDINKVKQAITKKTKAIIAVNLFGHPANLKALRSLADEHNLILIEDNAQGILATEEGKFAGTIGHIGIFSLNYHKHIHSGEGGMCVTNDSELSTRLQLIRNHAENVVESLQINNISGLVGFNYRLTELSAAVGIEQLKAVEEHVAIREKLARKLLSGLADLEGFILPKIRNHCRHVFYLLPIRINVNQLGISREQFSKALHAEGFPHFNGYVRPLYRLPIFQKRIAFGHYPFTLSDHTYPHHMCPVVERMYEKELICFENCMYDVDDEMIELLIEAVRKVHRYRMDLISNEQKYA